jgi:ABC-2 type transport system ATP-binding protein
MDARPMTASTDTSPAIEVRDLVKRYQKSKANAVDGVSFQVRRGEIFGLLGPNGAGKTTTIGVLITSVVPTSGSCSVMGIDVGGDPIGVKQRIAVVPQQSNLDRSLQVREILTFHAAYHSVGRKEREERADRLLNELGLADRKKDKVNRFSGGMSQRLMIARALMHSPDVLFLDEPTNNLDPQSRLFLWDRIRELNQQGLTILLTTHDMDEADKLCERIAIMDYGKILVDNTSAELKKMIPGGNALEIHVRIPESGDPARNTDLKQALETLPGVTKAEMEVGQPPAVTYRLYSEEARSLVGSAAQAVLATGAEVHDLHLKQASLEEVFIYLTGRHLR